MNLTLRKFIAFALLALVIASVNFFVSFSRTRDCDGITEDIASNYIRDKNSTGCKKCQFRKRVVQPTCSYNNTIVQPNNVTTGKFSNFFAKFSTLNICLHKEKKYTIFKCDFIHKHGSIGLTPFRSRYYF